MITVAEIERMERDRLVAAWSEVFGSPAPRGISRTFLKRLIAFEVQARSSGGLSRSVMAAIAKPAGKGVAKTAAPPLRPGGRLLREWNGVTHIVDVTDTGFVWNGKTWRSLSRIARAITGAHWSGPRFFGLGIKKGGRRT